MSIVVLGPQASPPARVQRSPDRERGLLFRAFDAIHLVGFETGRRGRLRSQDHDALIIFIGLTRVSFSFGARPETGK